MKCVWCRKNIERRDENWSLSYLDSSKEDLKTEDIPGAIFCSEKCLLEFVKDIRKRILDQ